jgi:molybdenum cofactor cytidylyltransferase
LETVPEYIGAAVLAVCDQPLLTARVIDQLVYTHRKLEKSIVASDYADTFGIPTLFSRELFPELLALSGGDGAKSVIERHLDEVISVPFAGGAIDLDTPEDYAKFLADEIVDEKADEMVDEMVDERGDEKADERAD